MNAKEKFWQKTCFTSLRGRIFNVFHDMHEKRARVMETGAYWTTNRRNFRKWVKKHGGKCRHPYGGFKGEYRYDYTSACVDGNVREQYPTTNVPEY